MAKEITDSSFDEVIKNSTKPILIDFWAPWCGPCKMLLPIIGELSTELEEKVDVYKCNVDENSDLAAKFGIQGIPALFILKDGKVSADRTGAASKTIIKQWIEENI